MATLLQKTEDPRQAYIVDKIKEMKIRFPVAELTEKKIGTKGNVSEVLSGKRAVSDAFFKRFCDAYELDGSYKPDKQELSAEKALLLAMLDDYAEWKASVTGQPYKQVKSELKKKATLILNTRDSWRLEQ